VQEAASWREWLLRAVAGDPADLQIMYGLDGSRRLPESELPWLRGYEGSAPVRIGNAAAGAVPARRLGRGARRPCTSRARAASCASGRRLGLQVALMDFLESHWDEPDNGLWEVRGPRRHFVHSKVMAWAAPTGWCRPSSGSAAGPVERWRALRDRIHADVCERGYDAGRGTFTQYYGGTELDAALLLLPASASCPTTTRASSARSRRWRAELVDDGFVLRYRPRRASTAWKGARVAFLAAASGWSTPARPGPRDDARRAVRAAAALRNDVGLLAEEWDPRAGRQVGNFPQAFSHEPLVTSARLLSRRAD
jgi:GH15 family glucan-1,4-alpha-glucosidase